MTDLALNSNSFKFVPPSFNEEFSSTNEIKLKDLLIDLGISIGSFALRGVPVLGTVLNSQVVRNVLSDKISDMISRCDQLKEKKEVVKDDESSLKNIVRNAKEMFGIKIKSSKNSISSAKVNTSNAMIQPMDNSLSGKITSFFANLNQQMEELRSKVSLLDIVGKFNINKCLVSMLPNQILNTLTNSIEDGYTIPGVRLTDFNLNSLNLPKGLRDPNNLQLINEQIIEIKKMQEEAIKRKEELENSQKLEQGSTLKLTNPNYKNAFISTGGLLITLSILYTLIEFIVLIYAKLS